MSSELVKITNWIADEHPELKTILKPRKCLVGYLASYSYT